MGASIDGEVVKERKGYITIDGETVTEVTMDGDVVWVPKNQIAIAMNEEVRFYEPDGTLIWGFEDSDMGQCNSVVVDNSGYIYVGVQGSPTLHKFDDEGSRERATSSPFWTNVLDVDVDPDGYVYGSTGHDDHLVAKVDDYLNEVWRNSGFYSDNISAIAVDTSGNVIACNEDRYVVKLDSNGNKKWQSGTYRPYVSSIAVDENDYIYVAYSYNSAHSERLEKLSPSGSTMWTFSPSRDVGWEGVAVSKNHVFGVGGRYIYFLGRSGNKQHEYEAGTSGTSLQDIAVGADEKVYAVSSDRYVYIRTFDNSDGSRFRATGGEDARGIAIMPGKYPHFQ